MSAAEDNAVWYERDGVDAISFSTGGGCEVSDRGEKRGGTDIVCAEGGEPELRCGNGAFGVSLLLCAWILGECLVGDNVSSCLLAVRFLFDTAVSLIPSFDAEGGDDKGVTDSIEAFSSYFLCGSFPL
jgi:hypothetical protein